LGPSDLRVDLYYPALSKPRTDQLISTPACLEAKSKSKRSPGKSESTASRDVFREVLAGGLGKEFRFYQDPPAADYELSIVATGLRSTLVPRREEAEKAMRFVAYAGSEE
jgi:hypothetical protein